MPTGVTDFRLSFIWTEFHDRLFPEPVPDAPFAFLGRQLDWADRFRSVQKYAGDLDGLMPPWPRHRGKDFWSMYLGQDPHDVDPWHAWKCFVPLRMRPLIRLAAPWLPGSVDAEGFFYPHGLGLLVTVRLRVDDPAAPWGLEEVVDAAHQVRSDAFKVRLPGEDEAEMKLDSLAAATRSFLRKAAYGSDVTGSSAEPYTVATFVRVDGVDTTLEVENQGDTHRALEAVTHWPTAWKIAPLPALKEAAVRDPDFPDAHVVYRRRRGRATWFPALAAPSEKHRKLSCYHRNQSFAAMQVESLAQLVSGTAKRLRAGSTLPLTQGQCARKAAAFLGRLYGGIDTYRSLACRDHLEVSDSTKDLVYLREHFGMSELH